MGIIAPPGGNPSGVAGGALAGQYPNPELAANSITPGALAANSVTATKVRVAVKPVPGGENTVTLALVGVPRQRVAAIVGNAVATKFVIAHGLATRIASVNILSATFEEPVTMLAKSVAINEEEIEVTFTVAPGAGVVNYVVITG